jgi:hypothetical protein
MVFSIKDRDMDKQTKRDLSQIKRDLIRESKCVSAQIEEALTFVDQLEKNFSKRVANKLLVRLQHLEMDEDLMEMMLRATSVES